MLGSNEAGDYFVKMPLSFLIDSIDCKKLHWHKEMETLLVLEGSVYVTVDGFKQPVHKGEMIVINSNQIHFIEHTQEHNRVLTMSLELNQLSSLGIPGNLYFSCMGNGDTNYHIADMRRCIANMARLMMNKEEGYGYDIYSYLFQFLSQLIQNFSIIDTEKLPVLLKDQDTNRLSRIIEYIDLNYSQNITLDKLAKIVFISPNHLTYFLKRTLGMSFQQYINMVRVREFADRLNEEPDKPLDLVCQQCGFSSIQYATKVFRTFYQMAPGEYRKNYQRALHLKKISDDMKQEYLPTYQETDYVQLDVYSRCKDYKNKNRIQQENMCIQGIDVDVADDGSTAIHEYMLKMISIGRASESLRAEVKQQLSSLQKDLRFSYIRFFGIFNDEMKVLNTDVYGNLIYSWSKVDYLLDFFINIGLRPFIDLASMPTYLTDGNNIGYSWIGNTTQPRDIALWRDLVQRFLEHCIDRFGRSEVEKWYIEVWKQPDLIFYWKGSQEEYFTFYEATAGIIRKILPKIKVGGPAISSMSVLQGEWIPNFIKYCKSNKVPLDYISFSIYPEIIINLKNPLTADDYTILSHDYVDYIYSKAKDQADGLPLIVDEWNISFMNGNPVNDSRYAATALLSTTFCQKQTPNMMAHSMVVDNYDERVHKDEEYHGGHGLLSCHGTKKMSYWAYWCLRQMGNRVLYHSDQVYITKSKDGIQLLLVNHPELDLAYDLNRIQKSNLDKEKKLMLRVSLNHCKGKLVKRTYTFSEECDPVEISGRSGITRLLNDEEAGYIISKSIPVFEKEIVESLNTIYITVELRPCEFKLILLQDN